MPDRSVLGRFVRHIGDRDVYAGSADHSVSEALYLTDPDGLGIEVYADRPRETWRTAGQELFMTTEPLDLRDLVRAGGDAPWTGMPAGTVIGHVHLHVGALDAASAFYHAALGLDRIVWSYPGALFLSAGGYHHHLGTNTWARGAVPAGDGEARLLEWELVLPDAAATAAATDSLQAAGADATAQGGDRLARDPWGTTVRLRAADGPGPPTCPGRGVFLAGHPDLRRCSSLTNRLGSLGRRALDLGRRAAELAALRRGLATSPRRQVASWKMMPSVCRRPVRTSLTPCRIVTR